jgi:CRP-like cAMP-binding protein
MVSSELDSLLKPWFDRWQLTDLSPLRPWIETMRILDFERDAMVLTAGSRERNIFLVESGLLRLFYTSPDGRERNKAFFGPGKVCGPISAVITDSPAPFSIQALEPSRLLRADYDLLLRHASRSRDLNRLQVDLLSEAFVRNEQREAMLLTCNAEQRYQWVLQREPELLERLPQFHIASYIGVDAVSLSRLKRKLNPD